MDNPALYQTIVTRKSVRRFAPQVEAPLLGQVQQACLPRYALVPENRFNATVQALQPDRDLITLLGAYGRLVAPPYVVVPTLEGSQHVLVDLGFRAQQVLIALVQLGLGTCFVGTLAHDEQARRLFQLQPGAVHAAVIAFGLPSQTLGARLHNNLVRTLAGAGNKLTADKVYYEDLGQPPVQPPPNWTPIIDAACAAPSAVNTQPWRFLGAGHHLYLFSMRHSSRYGRGEGAAYKYFDCGICLANIQLSLQALGLRGSLRLCSEPDEGLPPYPQELQPLAEIVLGDD